MIATRLRDDSLRRLFLGDGKDGIGRPANFERAGFLQVLALEEELGSGHGVQGRGRQDRCAVDSWGDARVRRENDVPRWRLVVGSLDRRGSAHRLTLGL